ncbi:MAG: hypothetical protein LKK00_08705 [Intestinimonas sp.]|jgi:chromosome segregation ATPase|nr:hypothetical protein [Intestinimonas sp.]
MGVPEQTFRTSVFGGFNRQDVLDYISDAAQTQAERTATLQRAREEAESAAEKDRTAAQRAEGQVAGLQQRIEELTKILEEKSAALTEKTKALADVEQFAAQAQQTLESLQTENEQMKAVMEKMRAGAAAYDELKDRTATIELEAHQRAQAIESAAEENAQKTREEVEQLLRRIQSGYERLRGDVDATLSHAMGELGRADKALRAVQTEFSEHDAALQHLLVSYGGNPCGLTAPEPLPLDEKEEAVAR